jgi:F-type H+-transporting ATPase subunit a
MIHISLAAEPLYHVFGVPINNSLITGIVGSTVIIALFVSAARRVTLHPKSKLVNAVETICEMILDLVDEVFHDRAKARKYFPFLMTIFMFILVNNWLGLLPGVGSITVMTKEGLAPLFRGANADLNTTLALAIISVVMTQIYAARELGVAKHLKKYFSLNPIMTFVGMLELVGEFSKMVSFSFRLFGNIFAGEVLLAVIAFLAPLAAPLPFFGLELFVGLVQALVFTMLTLVFLAIATTDHSEYNHAEESVGH